MVLDSRTCIKVKFIQWFRAGNIIIILNLNACILMNLYTVESFRPYGTTLGKGSIYSFEMALNGLIQPFLI